MIDKLKLGQEKRERGETNKEPFFLAAKCNLIEIPSSYLVWMGYFGCVWWVGWMRWFYKFAFHRLG